MGFRVKKSFGKGPFRLTLSRKGISTSFGVKGARITKKANGKISTTLGIPGSGISYTTESHIKTKTKNTQKNNFINKEQGAKNRMSSAKNYIEIQDPQTEGIQTKYNIWIMSFLILASIFLPLLFIVLFIYIKDNSFKKLKQPIPFEGYVDSIAIPNMFSYIKGTLNDEQFASYLAICSIVKNYEEETFSLAEINAKTNANITSYTFQKLYDMGYILRPSRGRYCLNAEKIKYILQKHQEDLDNKMFRYNSLVVQCEKANTEAIAHNLSLIKKQNAHK